jgi:hypothetical protein
VSVSLPNLFIQHKYNLEGGRDLPIDYPKLQGSLKIMALIKTFALLKKEKSLSLLLPDLVHSWTGSISFFEKWDKKYSLSLFSVSPVRFERGLK